MLIPLSPDLNSTFQDWNVQLSPVVVALQPTMRVETLGLPQTGATTRGVGEAIAVTVTLLVLLTGLFVNESKHNL